MPFYTARALLRATILTTILATILACQRQCQPTLLPKSALQLYSYRIFDCRKCVFTHERGAVFVDRIIFAVGSVTILVSGAALCAPHCASSITGFVFRARRHSYPRRAACFANLSLVSRSVCVPGAINVLKMSAHRRMPASVLINVQQHVHYARFEPLASCIGRARCCYAGHVRRRLTVCLLINVTRCDVANKQTVTEAQRLRCTFLSQPFVF